MDRRSFFKSLIAACAAPMVFVPKFEHLKWKKTETLIMPDDGMVFDFTGIIYRPNHEGVWSETDKFQDVTPIRFKADGNGVFVLSGKESPSIPNLDWRTSC